MIISCINIIILMHIMPLNVIHCDLFAVVKLQFVLIGVGYLLVYVKFFFIGSYGNCMGVSSYTCTIAPVPVMQPWRKWVTCTKPHQTKRARNRAHNSWYMINVHKNAIKTLKVWDANMAHCPSSSLVHVIACRLLGANPLHESIMTCCQLHL